MLIIDELIINGRKYVYTLKIQINLSNVQILISWQLRVQTIPAGAWLWNISIWLFVFRNFTAIEKNQLHQQHSRKVQQAKPKRQMVNFTEEMRKVENMILQLQMEVVHDLFIYLMKLKILILIGDSYDQDQLSKTQSLKILALEKRIKLQVNLYFIWFF